MRMRRKHKNDSLSGDIRGAEEIGVKYLLNDDDTLTAEKYINPNADAFLKEYPYKGKVDEDSIVKELSKYI